MNPDPRNANKAGEIFRHYKGGVYRSIMRVDLIPRADIGLLNSDFLFRALHSDDLRTIEVVATYEGCLAIDDSPSPRPPHPVEIYVSLFHGTIWCRRSDEFNGLVATPDVPRRRFEPIMLDHIEPAKVHLL